jgi:uncharacterized protein YkwD
VRNAMARRFLWSRQAGPVRPRGKLRAVPVLALVAATVAFALIAAGCTFQAQTEYGLARGVNQIRRDAGLPVLTVDPALSAVARGRAEDMATNNYFSHSPPDGCPVRCLIERADITPGWTGEVMAWNTASIAQTVDMTVNMWSNSAEHYSVITDACFERMGTGVAFTPGGTTYLVTVFEGYVPGCR